MNHPKFPKRSYYKEQYHRIIDRIMRKKERRIRRQYKYEKLDIGDQDFIPTKKNDD